MKLLRVDSDKTEKDIKRIEVTIGDKKFTITEYFGDLKIHAHSDVIIVKPCCANEINLASMDT